MLASVVGLYSSICQPFANNDSCADIITSGVQWELHVSEKCWLLGSVTALAAW